MTPDYEHKESAPETVSDLLKVAESLQRNIEDLTLRMVTVEDDKDGAMEEMTSAQESLQETMVALLSSASTMGHTDQYKAGQSMENMEIKITRIFEGLGGIKASIDNVAARVKNVEDVTNRTNERMAVLETQHKITNANFDTSVDRWAELGRLQVKIVLIAVVGIAIAAGIREILMFLPTVLGG